MNKYKVRTLSISDLHLGHRNTPIDFMVENLYAYFAENHKIFKNLDAIFFVGDTTDRLLKPGSIEYTTVLKFLSWMVKYCKTNNIILRILEGTPSHDWNQVRGFETVLSEFIKDIDFKYIDTLSIEYIDKLDMYILYIPDEHNTDAKVTYKEVKELMAELGIDKVDITLIHGQFHFQIPQVNLKISHNEQDYLDITRYYIGVGHIHTRMNYDRIIGTGSFDRLAHNEEEPKGAILHTSFANGSSEHIFIPNRRAMIYKTLRYTDVDDVSKLYRKVSKDIKKIPKHSRVRIIVSDNIINKVANYLVNEYPDYVITVTNAQDKKTITEVVVPEVKIEEFNITKDNIVDLLTSELRDNNVPESNIKLAKAELNKIIKEI